MALQVVLGLLGGLLAWVVLALALLVIRPRGGLLVEALRLLPDVVRLLKRLATDRSLSRGVRIRLALLLVYLAFTLDLISDFIPIGGTAGWSRPARAALAGHH